MNCRTLILSAGYGEGHNAAARALAAAFERAAGPGSTRVVDAFALASPRTNAISRWLYLQLINRRPQLWQRIYAWLDRNDVVERRIWYFRREIETLADLIRHERPAAICCTYPLYAILLEQLRTVRGEVPPVFNVVTDSISIHSLWWRAPCDGWFLPNADSADVLFRAGIAETRIHILGFPVPDAFTRGGAELTPPDLSRGARPRVLHLVNSGTRGAGETALHLMQATDWEITCAVGRDAALQRRLARVAATRPFPTKVLGWTDQIPQLLMTHHAVVSKAGGATTQEAIAAGCPMIVSQIVPGQEEGNYELLRRHGIGALATTPQAVVAALRSGFAENGRLCRQWQTALARLATPRAADRIAQHVMDTAATGSAGRAVRFAAPSLSDAAYALPRAVRPAPVDGPAASPSALPGRKGLS